MLLGGYTGVMVEEALLMLGVTLGPGSAVPPLSQRPLPAPPRLHHISVATKANPWAADSAGEMAAAQGTQVRLLGLGDARAPSLASGFGWAYALKLHHVQLAVAALPAEDLVLVSDAFDAYSVAPLLRFEAAFAEAAQRAAARAQDARPVEVLISAEAWCFPNQSLAGDFPAANLREALPFPNSGVYIGRAGALLRLLRDGPPYSIAETDDQDWFSRAYLASLSNASLPRAALDHDSIVAFSMGPLKSLRSDLAWDAAAGAWRDKATGSHPSIFHYNGDKVRNS